MKYKRICIAISILAISLAGFFIIIYKNKEVELPKTNFDTEAQLQNTNIKFKYPKDGFYNLGIDITNIATSENLIAGVHIESTAEFDRNAQSAYMVAEIKLLKNDKKFEDIEELVSFYKTDSGLSEFEKEYAKENGHVVDINGNKYFIYKVTEDAAVWHALTIIREGIIEISLAYTNSFTPYSEAIYKNNNGLFLEILENINFR
ncbi:MAG: hypothetical protein WC445_03615 [Patescibacteria group bacterium]